MKRALVLLLLAGPAWADNAVDCDGNVYAGEVAMSKDSVTVGETTLALEDVYLVEKADGTLRYAPDFATRLRAYESIARDAERNAYFELVGKAYEAKDYDLARECVEKAERAGLISRALDKHKRKLRRIKLKTMINAGLRAQAKAVGSIRGELMAVRAARALDGGRHGLVLLRETLRVAPDNARARELLAARAPKDFPLGDARVWLDWHLDLLRHGIRFAPQDEIMLKDSRVRWRKDLQGLVAGPIMLITPVKDSRTIGRCLAYGRLATTALEGLFATKSPVRLESEPMVVFLFESEKEYTTRTGTGQRWQDPARLQWSNGYYSGNDGFSRFYWYDDLDAERRIVGTCVHELTHHWTAQRNPRTSGKRLHAGQAGFWIVEGFATFMEEGLFDIDAGTWTPFNPRARSLDVVQALPEKSTIRWDRLYRYSKADTLRMPLDNKINVQGRWWLVPLVLSTYRLYYEQAAATCHFLYHAENGKYRQKLLDYVVAFEEQNREALDINTAFGMDAPELGKQVVAFAKAVSNGWKPK